MKMKLMRIVLSALFRSITLLEVLPPPKSLGRHAPPSSNAPQTQSLQLCCSARARIALRWKRLPTRDHAARSLLAFPCFWVGPPAHWRASTRSAAFMTRHPTRGLQFGLRRGGEGKETLSFRAPRRGKLMLTRQGGLESAKGA